MAKKDLVYTTIGTCRVAEPLGATVQLRNLRRNSANIYGFIHTSKEALQQIDYLEGREFPPELGRFLSPDGVLVRSPRQRADVFVVELSTVKEIVFGAWYLQINYLERTFRDRGELLDAFFRLKGERDPEARRRRFEVFPSFADTDALEHRILMEGYVRSTTRDELEADMAEIVARLPAEVVFVSHINVPNAGGQLIESRDRLCGWITEICRAKGYRHFDPSPHVTLYGQTRALAEAGHDLNHYTADFKPVLGSIVFDGVLTRVATGQPEPEIEAGSEPVVAPTVEAAPAPPAAVASEPLPEPKAEAVPEVQPVAAPAPVSRPVPVHASVQAALNEAKRRIADGDLDEAEIILHGLAAEDGRSAPIHTLRGTIAFHRGDTTAATAEFREAVEIDPAALEPRLMLVKSALRMSKLDEACSIASDLVRRAPDDLRIVLVAAKAMMRAKQFAGATAIWRRIADMRPELVIPLIEMARCEMKSRNYEAGLAAADEALRRDPREAGALVIKSDALLKLKRMRELAAVSLDLAAIEPKAAMAAVPALISSLHPEEAASIIATAHETGEVDIDAVMRAALIRTLERRGKVANERGDTPAAAAAWKAILLIDPGSHRAASGLRRLFSPLIVVARAKAEENDVPGAVAAYEAALAIHDDSARILRELALVHERGNEWYRASQRWAQLARVSEQGLPFKRRAARAAMRAERYDAAVRLYHELDCAGDEQGARILTSAMRRLVRAMREDFSAGHLELAAYKAYVVLEIDPDSEAGQRTFRKVMAAYSRRLREAVTTEDAALQEEISLKMLELEPSRRDALKVLARLYRLTKRYRDGIEVLQRLTEIEPDDMRHWLKLARSCRAIRLYDRGVPAALKALEIEPGNAATVSLLSDMLNRQAAA